ncbi:unnamed protein product, partial [Porites lobata]
MSDATGVAVTVVTAILIIVCIVGNTLVCAVIKKNRDMRIPINYLLLNMAVADILYSTFLIPELISTHSPSHPQGLVGRILCLLLTKGNLAWLGAGSSIFSLVAIAAERYYAVTYPLENKGKLTSSKLKNIIAASWICPLVLDFPMLLVTDFHKKKGHNFCTHAWPEKWMSQAYTSTWRVYLGLSFTLLVVFYSRVVYCLWFKRNDDNVLTEQQKGVLRLRKRVTLMVLTVSAIFGICWGIESAFHIVDDFVSKLSPVFFLISHTMVTFNSAVNPFAYALINQRFRAKMKRMVCHLSSSDEKPSLSRERKEMDTC